MPRPRGDIRERVLDAARSRFLQQGVDGASLRNIAEDAKTNVGMIYYYFPTKEDLFTAVVEETYATLLAELEALAEPSQPVAVRLVRLSERIGHASDDELDVVRIVVREVLVSSDRRARLLARFSRGHLGLLLRTVADGVARGELDPRHPLPILAVCAGVTMVFPQFVRRLVATDASGAPGAHPFGPMPEPSALAARLLDVLMHGIAAQDVER